MDYDNHSDHCQLTHDCVRSGCEQGVIDIYIIYGG